MTMNLITTLFFEKFKIRDGPLVRSYRKFILRVDRYANFENFR